MKANYLLVVDNLLDLSHVAYVHDTTIGNAAVAEDAEVITTRHADSVRITREMINVPAPRHTPSSEACARNFDRWQLSEFRPPCYFLINNGSATTGMPPDPADDWKDKANGVFRSTTASPPKPKNDPSVLGHRP